MRRTALTIVATVIGLVLLLQFKTHSGGSAPGRVADLGLGPSRSQHVVRRHHPSSPPPSRPATTAARPTPPRTRSSTGQPIHTPYGVVQVRVVEAGHRLTDVVAVQLPHDSARSSEIAANAAPILRKEAVQAGSAHIDIVSGATYTSDGYAQSLQSALDNA
jgi:uncharacterized protein with FMN-binding domain